MKNPPISAMSWWKSQFPFKYFSKATLYQNSSQMGECLELLAWVKIYMLLRGEWTVLNPDPSGGCIVPMCASGGGALRQLDNSHTTPEWILSFSSLNHPKKIFFIFFRSLIQSASSNTTGVEQLGQRLVRRVQGVPAAVRRIPAPGTHAGLPPLRTRSPGSVWVHPATAASAPVAWGSTPAPPQAGISWSG